MNLVDNFRNGIKEYIKRSEWQGWDEGEFIKELGIKNIKLAFISEVMFGICTYDTGLDIEFGRDILEVMEVIYENKNYEYIKKNINNYKKFILVANLLDKYNWIEWGTSIRGCWFDYFSEFKLEIDDLEEFNMEEIIFDNECKDIGELIEYLKNEEL